MQRPEALEKHLFSDPENRTFAILDGACIPDLLEKLYSLEPKYECLHMGELEPDMAEVAPYLVELEPGTEFTTWVFTMGWGKNWGVFPQSSSDLRELRQHFRRFLVVYNSEGRPLMFRFYDPRVLRGHLTTAKPEETKALFGPVASYVIEDEDPNRALCFKFNSGVVKSDRLELNVKS